MDNYQDYRDRPSYRGLIESASKLANKSFLDTGSILKYLQSIGKGNILTDEHKDPFFNGLCGCWASLREIDMIESESRPSYKDCERCVLPATWGELPEIDDSVELITEYKFRKTLGNWGWRFIVSVQSAKWFTNNNNVYITPTAETITLTCDCKGFGTTIVVPYSELYFLTSNEICVKNTTTSIKNCQANEQI